MVTFRRRGLSFHGRGQTSGTAVQGLRLGSIIASRISDRPVVYLPPFHVPCRQRNGTHLPSVGEPTATRKVPLLQMANMRIERYDAENSKLAAWDMERRSKLPRNTMSRPPRVRASPRHTNNQDRARKRVELPASGYSCLLAEPGSGTGITDSDGVSILTGIHSGEQAHLSEKQYHGCRFHDSTAQ